MLALAVEALAEDGALDAAVVLSVASPEAAGDPAVAGAVLLVSVLAPAEAVELPVVEEEAAAEEEPEAVELWPPVWLSVWLPVSAPLTAAAEVPDPLLAPLSVPVSA